MKKNFYISFYVLSVRFHASSTTTIINNKVNAFLRKPNNNTRQNRMKRRFMKILRPEKKNPRFYLYYKWFFRDIEKFERQQIILAYFIPVIFFQILEAYFTESEQNKVVTTVKINGSILLS